MVTNDAPENQLLPAPMDQTFNKQTPTVPKRRSAQFTLTMEESMGIGRSHLAATIIVLALSSTPTIASAWSDSMPHYGSTSACSTHMTTTNLGTAPVTRTFYLCKANSQATSWSAAILNSSGNALPNCGLNNVPVATNQFTCSNIPKGYYRGYIYYWVPGNSFPHTESYYYIVQ